MNPRPHDRTSGLHHFPCLRWAVMCVWACMLATGPAAAETEYRLKRSDDDLRLPRPALEPYQVRAAEYRLAAPLDAIPAPAGSVAAPADDVPEKPFAREVLQAATEAGVEPGLVHALIEVESAYRPGAVSPKGAVGLMQLLPETAQRYGVTNLTNVPENLRAGTRHLRSLLDLFGERLDLVLAAYNAGEGAVRKYNNNIPPYRETRNYVPAVLKRYRVPVKPQPTPVTPAPPAAKEYLPGTRLDPLALRHLP